MNKQPFIPDIPVIADGVISDLRSDPGDTGQGRLDAIGTMTDLTEDDLMALVIELARRQV